MRIEETLVPLGEMALSSLQEKGADDVVKANRAGCSIEAEKQREVVEPTAELLGGERTQAPELFQDPERNVLVLREDCELLEAAHLVSGQPPEARPNRSGDGLVSRFEILAVEDGQSLGVESLIRLPERLRQRKTVPLRHLSQLPVDDLQQQGPFAEARGESPQIDSCFIQ